MENLSLIIKISLLKKTHRSFLKNLRRTQPVRGNPKQLELLQGLLLAFSPLPIQIKPLGITSLLDLGIWGSLQFRQWWIFTTHTPTHPHKLTDSALN